ncbi:MAG TPA: multidrug effflux MFS transporter [Polyangiales bacterium]|nr:multidrug effflux MFS transporter [Polyangiales bacterium]
MQSTSSPRYFTLVLGVLTAFSAISTDMYLPSLPAISVELNAPVATVQLTLAAFMIGMGIGQLVYGPVSDRWGRRPPLLFGVSLYILASVGCVLARSIEALIAARFLQALGGAAGPVIARAIVRDTYSGKDIARVLSLMMLVMGVAPILAPLAGSAMLGLFGWRSIFVAFAVFGLVAWTLALIAIPRGRSLAQSGTLPQSLGSLIADRGFVAAALTGSFGSSVLFAYLAGSSFVFIGVYHFTPQQFAVLFGLNAAGFIGASQLNRALLVRFPTHAIAIGAALVMCCAGGLLLSIVSIAGHSTFAAAFALFVCIGSIGMMVPNTTAIALHNHAARAGVASSVLGATQFAVAASVMSVVGVLHDGTARPMSAVIAISACIAFVLSLRLRSAQAS